MGRAVLGEAGDDRKRLCEALVRSPRGDVQEVRGVARWCSARMEDGRVDAMRNHLHDVRIEAELADRLVR